MSASLDSAARERLAGEYSCALDAYILGADEAALTRACELGRRAVTAGLGVLELALMHHEALRKLLAQRPLSDGDHVVAAAAQFLTEGLSHFEMTLRLDDAVRKANAAAEEANRELESFSYSVAHDLRAPLRCIDGFSKALLEECKTQLDDDGKRYLRYVRESAQRMSQLIDDLLALSRVSRGELDRAHVNLSLIVRSILERLRAAEPARRAELIVQEGVFAHCDARLLTAALENLFGNAWKFTNKRPLARIEFGVEPDKRPAVYFIRDNGAGFDMTYAGKLFGVFQRLHSVQDFEGTGVGLATVQRIVRRHGGRVWAEGAVDRGATFYFILEEPVARA